ncbi:hypothetical protein [Gemmobacter sp. 24YEA27]|uniref:hypothetical protein n=1 Tax=Gemmobacter sp. 24YEA27 TaxID=3040672 RepID=UPI0024B36174|nr:hypothetical protein [Gemmobacter sp. 24YEA27]
MLDAATRTGTQVIWDLMHYGWPDGLDIWSPAFVDCFAAFARAAALHLRDRSDAVPFWCPINEISFFSWAGGDARYLNPFASGRGFELKVQLARAAIAAMRALRDVDPRARFVHAEPLIAIHHDPQSGRPLWEAQGWHDAQFQAFDLIAGRIWPQIDGAPEFLDIVGSTITSTINGCMAGHPLTWIPSTTRLCPTFCSRWLPATTAPSDRRNRDRGGSPRRLAGLCRGRDGAGVPAGCAG